MDELKERDAWRDAILEAVKYGRHYQALKMLACNEGNRGDIMKFVVDFTENATPSAGWRAL